MPQSNLKVELVQHTLDTQSLIALGARLCYAGGDLQSLQTKIAQNDQQLFLEKLLEMDHLSVLEHASMSFLVEGVSRALLAQLTRHRIASFSVQSQRYVSYQKGFGYIIPPSIMALGEEAINRYKSQMDLMHTWYTQWQQDLGNTGEGANEDARFVLPNACETRILFTMNLRELRHFFALRLCCRAQWEIRNMSEKMFELAYPVAPSILANAGPACLSGRCNQGKKSCMKATEVRNARKQYIVQHAHQAT